MTNQFLTYPPALVRTQGKSVLRFRRVETVTNSGKPRNGLFFEESNSNRELATGQRRLSD